MTDMVWLLAIDDGDEADYSVYASEAAAKRILFGYVADCWAKDGPDETMPADRDDAIEAYFANQEDNSNPESYFIELRNVIV